MNVESFIKVFFGLLCVLVTFPAQAVSVNIAASNLNGNILTDNSVEGLLNLDVSYTNSLPVALVLDLSPTEQSAGSVNFRGGFTTDDWTSNFGIGLGGSATFDVVGTVLDPTGALVSDVVTTATAATITFDSALTGGSVFLVGEFTVPPGFPTLSDWAISFPNGTQTITMALQQNVPEPVTATLLALGIAGIGYQRRRMARQ